MTAMLARLRVLAASIFGCPHRNYGAWLNGRVFCRDCSEWITTAVTLDLPAPRPTQERREVTGIERQQGEDGDRRVVVLGRVKP